MDKRTIARKRKLNEYVKGYKFGRFDLESDLENTSVKYSKAFRTGYYDGKFHKRNYDEENYANLQKRALIKFLERNETTNPLEQKMNENKYIQIKWATL